MCRDNLVGPKRPETCSQGANPKTTPSPKASAPLMWPYKPSSRMVLLTTGTHALLLLVFRPSFVSLKVYFLVKTYLGLPSAVCLTIQIDWRGHTTERM